MGWFRQVSIVQPILIMEFIRIVIISISSEVLRLVLIIIGRVVVVIHSSLLAIIIG